MDNDDDGEKQTMEDDVHVMDEYGFAPVDHGWAWMIVLGKRKGRNLTQSSDKNPHTIRKLKSRDHTKTPPNTLITQRLRTELLSSNWCGKTGLVGCLVGCG